MEAHAAVQKVKTLSEKAGTAYTISKQKATAAGMTLPDVPPIENRLGDMLESMRGEIERLKAIKEPSVTAAPAPAPVPVKAKRVVKKKVVEKKAPEPKEPEPEPIMKNEIVVPVLSARDQNRKDQQERQANYIDLLRSALGRN